MSDGGGVKRNVDRDMIGVGEDRALFKRNVGIGVAENESGNAATLEFLAQTASKDEGYIFFDKRAAEGFTAVIATMRGVHDCEVVAGNWRRGRAGRVARRGRES